MVIWDERALSLTTVSPTLYASKAYAYVSWSFGARDCGYALQNYEQL